MMLVEYLCNQKYNGTIVLEYDKICYQACLQKYKDMIRHVYRNTKDTSGASNRNSKSCLSVSAKNMKLQMNSFF